MTLNLKCFFYFLATTTIIGGRVYGQASITDSMAMPENLGVAKSNELYIEALKAKLHQDNRRAIKLFEQFTGVDKTTAAAYYELSRLYDDEKKYEKAEQSINNAVKLVDNNKWYNEQQANILAKQGKYEAAADIISKLVYQENTNTDYPLIAADYYSRAKKFDKALQFADIAIQRSGNDEEITLKKSEIYLDMNDVEKAAEVIRSLIAQYPKNASLRSRLGLLYDNNNLPTKGFETYKKADEELPGEPEIEMGFSSHYLRLKDTANFRRYARKAITNDKLDADTQLQLFLGYIQGMSDSMELTEGMPLLERLLSQQPGNSSLLAIYGEFLETSKQPEKAIIQYKKSLAIKQSVFPVWKDLLGVYAFSSAKNADSLIKYSVKAMKLFPTQSLTHYFNGLGHYNKKDYGAAIKAIERAVDIIPDNDIRTLAVMHSFLGEIYNTTQQFQLSDKAFDKALTYDPEDATVLNNYSYFLSERGQELEKAKNMSGKSLKIRPNESTFLDTYGWILYKTGDLQNAKTYIEKAISNSDRKSDGALYDHLGDIYYKLNDKVKAVQHWKIAKEKGCDNLLLPKKISEEKLYE